MTTRIPIVEKILSANDRLAAENRSRLDEAGLFAINIMASPGAGKTSLIEKTVFALKDRLRIGMINGDIATSFDADRATAAGATAIQINICASSAGFSQAGSADCGKCWKSGVSC
jgi:hydrogenase nickel incorporation protein HypB